MVSQVKKYYAHNASGKELLILCNKATQNNQTLFLELRDGNITQIIKNIKEQISLIGKISKMPLIDENNRRHLSTFLSWLNDLLNKFQDLEKTLNSLVF